MLIATPILVKKSSRSTVLGLPLQSIASAYFLVEFIAGLFFIFLGGESYKTALLTQILIAGVYAILLLANMIANEHTADSIKKHENETEYVKKTSSRVKLLIGKMSDKKVNKEIEKLYDLLHASPTKSVDKVNNLEVEVSNKITELENAVQKGNDKQIISILNQITALVKERNDTIKRSK